MFIYEEICFFNHDYIIFLGCKFDIYASEKVKFKNEKVEFVVISSEMTEVGKIYYVRRENTSQTYSFLDNRIYHFQYSQKALGPSPRIR